jgi:hypothetical protein
MRQLVTLEIGPSEVQKEIPFSKALDSVTVAVLI